MRRSRVRHLLVGSIAASLLGSTLAFAPAPAPAPAAPADTPDVPDVRVEVRDDGTVHRTVAGLSDRFGFAPDDDLRSLTTWRERVRRTIESRGVATASAMDECGEECEDSPGPGVWTSVEPTGDLDGDGTDDVLVLETTYSEDGWTSSTVARSGADGAELWASRDAGLGFVATVPDVDGDGLVDLVSAMWMYGMAHGGSCTLDLSCSFTESVTDVLQLTVARGATGEVVGEHAVTGTYEFASEDTWVETPTGWAGTEELRVTVEDGYFGFALVDLDGDGTHQLVHESFDATFTERTAGTINDTPMGWADGVAWHAVEELEGEVVIADLVGGTTESVVALTDAIPWVWVVDRPDGDRLLVDALPEAGEEFAGCVFVDPVVGDCGDDRGLPTSGANDAAPTRTLYGEDLEPIWEVPLPDWSFVVHGAGADLNGDGVEDLFDLRIDLHEMHEYVDDADAVDGVYGFEDLVVAVDGATGEELWTARATVLAAAGDTVVGGRIRHDEQLSVDGLVLDPATGLVLAERELVTMAVPDDDPDTLVFGGAWLDLVPLTGGDLDVLTEASVAEYELVEDCEVWEDPDGTTYEWCHGMPGELLSEAVELRGVDGRALQDLVALDDPSFWLLEVADLDGGDAELVGVHVGAEQEAVRALRLDGTTLWTLTPSQAATGLVHTPDGTVDVVVVDHEAGSYGVHDGADLTARWAVPLDSWSSGSGGALAVQ